MTKIAMVLGHDLLIPNEDTRVYREALALIKTVTSYPVLIRAKASR